MITHLHLLIAFFFFTTILNAQPVPDAWDVLRTQLTLNHDVTQPQVQSQIRWLTSHPSYLQELAQAEPYIYHIITEIKKRKLPGEIALIPMIESAYDPFAYSGAGAAGLWQLMPGTGTDLGLKRDWWYDGRRSIGPSTDAALNYLAYLHKFFHGDWILAFAAYDSGEGTMSRIIKNSHLVGRQVSFWKLAVPQETRAYVPRLLALAEIIQNPKRYHVELPHIPHIPYFKEVNIGSQIDLNHAAKLAGISYKTLIKLNPGFNRWATAPYRPYKLLIPTSRVQDFSRNLANFPEDKRVSWTRHQVSAGDNLVLIAQKYHTTVNLIKELNQLKSNTVKKGQYVLIPNKKQLTLTPVPKSKLKPKVELVQKSSATHHRATEHHTLPTRQYKVIHIVQRSDSFRKIQQKYGVTPAQIKQWNRLNPQLPLHVGQNLIIWKQQPQLQAYYVRRGDNVNSIAKRHKIHLSRLVQLNPELRIRPLRLGQRLLLG